MFFNPINMACNFRVATNKVFPAWVNIIKRRHTDLIVSTTMRIPANSRTPTVSTTGTHFKCSKTNNGIPRITVISPYTFAIFIFIFYILNHRVSKRVWTTTSVGVHRTVATDNTGFAIFWLSISWQTDWTQAVRRV